MHDFDDKYNRAPFFAKNMERTNAQNSKISELLYVMRYVMPVSHVHFTRCGHDCTRPGVYSCS